jgi:hypothetical protein
MRSHRQRLTGGRNAPRCTTSSAAACGPPLRPIGGVMTGGKRRGFVRWSKPGNRVPSGRHGDEYSEA